MRLRWCSQLYYIYEAFFDTIHCIDVDDGDGGADGKKGGDDVV